MSLKEKQEEGIAEPRAVEEPLRMLMEDRLKREAEFAEERRRPRACGRKGNARTGGYSADGDDAEAIGILDGPGEGVKEGRK